MIEFIYALGKSLGLAAMGWTMGLCTIEIYENMRGKHGPIYTSLTQRKPGILFGVIVALSLTGVYALLIDLARMIA